MVAPGGFNEEDTSPTAEQPDVEVVDYTPQGRAATSPTAGRDLDGNNFGKPHPQTTHQAIINISTPDLNSTRGTDQQPPPSDFFNTLATHQSPVCPYLSPVSKHKLTMIDRWNRRTSVGDQQRCKRGELSHT